jgi:hypothetical protein
MFFFIIKTLINIGWLLIGHCFVIIELITVGKAGINQKAREELV